MVKVVSRKEGKIILSKEIRTAGKPYKINLVPDREIINADGQDLCFITVEVLDKEGNLCPLAQNQIKFSIEGEGEIVGVDNGNSTSMERFKSSERKAFYGKCLVVVRSNDRSGIIRLSAKSDGLTNMTTEIKTKKRIMRN